ncbi:MAG TPA: non-canonical purine NTP pyrophosphatase [Candidatus Saccharimonadales bacterium]|nr:non-canonical purine NTP pyrophosphatase [Candidatus Saccharimonadales bacterium]
MSHELIYGTRNPSKIAQVQDALRGTNIHVVGLGDIQVDVEEDGATPEENARKKAVEYAQATKKTVLSMDAALYFNDLDKTLQPGLYVRRIPRNTSATDDELITYYTNLINDHGGSLDGYWEFSFALGRPDGTSDAFVSQTHRKFVGTPDSNTLPGYPLESIQIDPQSSKYITELSPEEQAASWRETLGAPLAKFITKYYLESES